MKVKFANNHGAPQFVILAESEEDRAMLSMFLDYGDKNKKKFQIHGSCYSCDHSATTSFNFGWSTNYKKPSFWQKLKEKWK